jgi:hypothetical protein
MMRLFATVLLLICCGCAYNPRVTVYGATGKPYIAPDLCAAVIACQQATEPKCYYNSTAETTANGNIVESACKVAK